MKKFQRQQLNKALSRRKEERYQEALSRATGNMAVTNYPAIFAGFAAKGIPETDILPRQNIFTYEAWKALGRYVKKGEHGVQVLTYITHEVKTKADPDFVPEGETEENAAQSKSRVARRPWSTTVFHVSQTEARKEGAR